MNVSVFPLLLYACMTRTDLSPFTFIQSILQRYG